MFCDRHWIGVRLRDCIQSTIVYTPSQLVCTDLPFHDARRIPLGIALYASFTKPVMLSLSLELSTLNRSKPILSLMHSHRLWNQLDFHIGWSSRRHSPRK